MTRPKVNINAKNKLAELRQHLDKHLPTFKEFKGLIGITLNGGMSRGYADHLSEVDVTFYLTPQTYQAWQQERAPIVQGIMVLDGQLYDIKACDYEVEMAKDWDQVTLWDSSYAKILHDPDGKLSAMFDNKLGVEVNPEDAGGLLFQCYWYCDLAGTIWVHRRDAVQGHQMLNQAVDRLVQALFIANQEFVPHEKWLLHMSRTLDWTPENWENRLTQAMSTGDMSTGSLQTRIDLVRGLREEVETYVHSTYFPELPVELSMKSHYECLLKLVEKGSMTLAEWKEMAGESVLNSDPFYPVIRVEGDCIVLDCEAVNHITAEEMYSWHYAIIRAVRGY